MTTYLTCLNLVKEGFTFVLYDIIRLYSAMIFQPAMCRLLIYFVLYHCEIRSQSHQRVSNLICISLIALQFHESIVANIRLHFNIHRLMARRARGVKVSRNGKWTTMERGSCLFPGDIIMIKIGDEVPADIRLLGGNPLQIDQSAFTGDCAQVTKRKGDIVYCGSSCKHGGSEAVVVESRLRIRFGTSVLSGVSSRDKYLDRVLKSILNLSICLTAIAISVELIVMVAIEHRAPGSCTDYFLALIIGGIPIALRWTTRNAISKASNLRDLLSGKGAILKRIHVVKEMAEMDVLCCDTSRTFAMKNLIVLKDMIKVLDKEVDAHTVILMAARSCQAENYDAIDEAILGTLDDPKEAWSGIRDVSFQSHNKIAELMTTIYTDSDGTVHQVCKGIPQEVIHLVHNENEREQIVTGIAYNYRSHGWLSVVVAHQVLISRELNDNTKNQWKVIGLIPLSYTPRSDGADQLRRASDLGINVKLITANTLEVAIETGRRLGMSTNMYPAFSLFRQLKDENSSSTLPIKDLIEKADGFSDVTPEHKYEIVKQLQSRGHICGMTVHLGVDAYVSSDTARMGKPDISIAVATAADSVRRAADIVLNRPGLEDIIQTVITCRKISQRIKAYAICTIATTVHTLLSFLLSALIWKFVVPPMLLLLLALLNDVLNIATYASYEVKPSSKPDKWKLSEVLSTGIFLGAYFASTTVIIFWAANNTNIFQMIFGVASLKSNYRKLESAMYLQMSTSSQILVLFTQARQWSSAAKQDQLYVFGQMISQMVALLIAVYANEDWLGMSGIGWDWAGVIWFANIMFSLLLAIIKLFIRQDDNYSRGQALGTHLDTTKTRLLSS